MGPYEKLMGDEKVTFTILTLSAAMHNDRQGRRK